MRRTTRVALLFLFLCLGVGCGGGDPLSRLQARRHLEHGDESYTRGEHARAVEQFEAALKWMPDLGQAHLGRAYSKVMLFRAARDSIERRQLADDAAASFDAYLRVTPSQSPPGEPSRERIEQHVLTLFIESNQSAKVIERLTAQFGSRPPDAATLQLLSRLADNTGDVEGSIRWMRRRIELEPNNAAAHHQLGVFAWQAVAAGRVPDPARAEAIIDLGLQAELEAVRLMPNGYEELTYANLLYREKASRTTNATWRAEYEQLANDMLRRARATQPEPPNE